MTSSYLPPVGVTIPHDFDSFAFNPFELNTDKGGIYDDFLNPDLNLFNSKNVKLSCEYFSDDQFNDLSLTLLHDEFSMSYAFSTMHLNVRSMPKKL